MRLLDEFEGLFLSQINVIKSSFALVKLEAKLACLSVYPLIVNLCLLLVNLIGIWLSGLVLLFYILMVTFNTIWIAFTGVFLVNALLLGLILICLQLNLKKMSFEKTRAYLSTPNNQEFEVNESTQTNPNCNSKLESDIADPTT